MLIPVRRRHAPAENHGDVSCGLQKSVQKIVSLIKADPHITTQTIADQLGINRSGVARHIKRLQEQGVIRRIGPDKGGYWEVTND